MICAADVATLPLLQAFAGWLKAQAREWAGAGGSGVQP